MAKTMEKETEETKTLKQILDDLDMARTEAHREIYKMQAFLKLCLSSEFTQNSFPKDPLDWFSIVLIIQDLVSKADEQLNEVEGFTSIACIKGDKLLSSRGVK